MIYQLTDELLYTPTQKFDFTNPEISGKVLFENMRDTMISLKGVGLTCNQVGLPYSMFVFGDFNSPENIVGCFNPEILSLSSEKTTLEEGCLSFKGVVVPIERSDRIRVRYQDYLGNEHTEIFRGLTARIFQHEMEHIRGFTFLTNLSKLKRDMVLKKARKKARYRMKNERYSKE